MGQVISTCKCSILRGNKEYQEDVQEVINILYVATVSFEDKYLGLLVPAGSIVKGKFKSTYKKERKIMNDWCQGDTN